MKTWLTFILITLFTLTACASPSSASPTPTIVRLDRSTLTATATEQAAEVAPTASTTPTAAPAAETATSTLQPAVSETPTPMATATLAPAQAEIVSAGLNVREGPGVGYAVIGTVTQGNILTITGVSADGNWLQIVTLEDQPGWISSQADYTRVTGSLADVPQVRVEQPAAQPATSSAQDSAGSSQRATAGDRLVFATRSGGDLYVVNRDGTNLQKLAGGVIDPVVSPDGTQVAFTRWDGAEFGTLYVMNLDGSGERAILGEIRQAKSPAWSPDGQAIIVSFQHGGLRDPQEECRRYDFGEQVRIPDNAQITGMKVIGEKEAMQVCFIRGEDLQWGLRRINLTGGEFEDLPADLYSFSPTWDPQNPARLIYDGQVGLMQLDVASGELQSFTSDVRDTAPVFSPDGTKLALTYRQHDHWEVYTYDLATGSRQRLTKPPLLADPQYNSAAPAWSPEGSHLAFVTDRSGQWEIWVMNADGSNQQPLFSTEVQAQLGLDYQGVNERLLNWVGASPTAVAPEPTSSGSQTEVGNPMDEMDNVSLSGTWDIAFGTLALTQRDSMVEGSTQWFGGTDTGHITGIVVADLHQFQGIWISDRTPSSQNLMRWQLAADENSFSGVIEGDSTSQQWCGVRSGQPLPAGCGFSGVWQLRFGSPPGMTGQATLTQTGQTVTGVYVDSQGHTGEMVDQVVTVQSMTEMKLTGVWRNDQGQQDTFEWRLDLTTGRTFQGRRDPGNSEWCGWREGSSAPEPCGWED